jgi:tetratricopeptide (TPR) repeat protein
MEQQHPPRIGRRLAAIVAAVGAAQVDSALGSNLFTNDRVAYLSAAETALIKAQSIVPNYALAHLILGIVQIFTNRAIHGIAECERALALDRNLATAHAFVGFAKYTLGRPDETEAHIKEALRISPRDVLAYQWMMFAGFAKLMLHCDADAAVWFRRSIEANRNFPIAHVLLGVALALLGESDEARAAARTGCALNPDFNLQSYRSNPVSDNPIYLAERERICEGMRMAGVPEG